MSAKLVNSLLFMESSHTTVDYVLVHSDLGGLGEQVLVADRGGWVIRQRGSLLGQLLNELGVILEESLGWGAFKGFLDIVDKLGFGIGSLLLENSGSFSQVAIEAWANCEK